MRVYVQLLPLCTPWAGHLSFNVGRPLCCWFSCTVVVVVVVVFSSLLSLAGNVRSPYLGRAKSSATHSYLCVHFRVCRQGWGCQCLGFLTCAQMLMHVLHIGFVLTSVQLTNTLLLPHGAVPSDCLKQNWNDEDRSRGKYKDTSKQALLTLDTHRNIHRSYSYSRSQLLPAIKQEAAAPVQIMRQ